VASPRWIASTSKSVGEDVAVENVAVENEENLAPPSSVGGGGGVVEDSVQVLDVRDPGGLEVEVGDHGVVRATRGSSIWLGQSRRRRLLRRGDALASRGVEEALRLGGPASKSVSGGPLVLPGEGGYTHTLLGSDCSGLGVLQGRSEGAVGGRDGGGTQRKPTEEGGGGEGSGRWRYAVEGDCGGSWGRTWHRGRQAAKCPSRPPDEQQGRWKQRWQGYPWVWQPR
jgi:hypothetical protein